MEENLSYATGATDKPLISATFGDLLDDAIEKNKNKTFIISRHQNKTPTFGEIIEEAENLVLGLIQIGLKAGDKIGIIVNNSIEAIVVNLACIRGGFVSVNLCPVLEYRELDFCIKKSKINCMISLDKYRNFSVIDKLKKIAPEISYSENSILNSKNVPNLKSIIIISDITYKGTFNYDTVISSAKHMSKNYLRNIQNRVRSHDIHTLLYTSGTTGNPKAVGLTHYQIINNVHLLQARLELHKNEFKFCFYLPLYHLFGHVLVYFSLLSGTPLVLPSYYYNPEENLKAISEENCTFLTGPPTMFADLIRIQKEKKLPMSPKIAFSGAATCSNKILREIKEVLNIKKMAITYGSTEALIMTLHWLDLDKDTTFSSSVGNLLDHLEAKVVNNNGTVVPIRTTGELYIRGYSVIKNYLYENSQSQSFDEDGWNKTGDAAYLDNDKKVYIIGRLKEIINRGGENISPIEIEKVLERHPNILEVGVVGSYHERLGEEVCACIRIKPDSTVTLEDVKDFCKGQLSYFKIPSRIHIMDSFPKTSLGKLQRLKLLAQVNLSSFEKNGKTT